MEKLGTAGRCAAGGEVQPWGRRLLGAALAHDRECVEVGLEQEFDAVLRDAGATPSHVVRVNAFVTGREHLPGYMAARDVYFGSVEPPPASTLMVVSGFAREAFLVEVEVIAAVPSEDMNDVI